MRLLYVHMDIFLHTILSNTNDQFDVNSTTTQV